MKSDILQPGVLQNLLVEVHDGVWVVHAAGLGGGEQIGALRVPLVLLHQQLRRLQVGPHVLIRMARTAAVPHTARRRRNTINRLYGPHPTPETGTQGRHGRGRGLPVGRPVLALYRMKFRPRGKIGEIS